MRAIRNDWLPHTISIEAYNGSGAYGPIYGAAVNVRAKVEHGLEAQLNPMVTAHGAKALIFIEPTAIIKAESKITWEDPYTGVTHTYTVIEVSPKIHLNGTLSHYEVVAK